MSRLWSTWGLRALALALAILAWSILSVGQREQLTEVAVEPIVAYRPPEGYTVLEAPDTVRVRLQGPSSSISRLIPGQVSVAVELSAEQTGLQQVALSAANVTAPVGLQVLAIDPPALTLQLDRVISDLKPIDVELTGEPAAGAVALAPSVFPDQALVRGPESRVNLLSNLTTKPISLDGHAIDFTDQAEVVSGDPLVRVMEPLVVRVTVFFDIPNAPTAQDGSDEPTR
jgi:YbbR domain-containing protein